MTPSQRICEHCNGTGFEPDDRAIGQLMRERRMQRGITLTEMATRLQLTKSYLSDLEVGRRHWTRTNLERYEDVFR